MCLVHDLHRDTRHCPRSRAARTARALRCALDAFEGVRGCGEARACAAARRAGGRRTGPSVITSMRGDTAHTAPSPSGVEAASGGRAQRGVACGVNAPAAWNMASAECECCSTACMDAAPPPASGVARNANSVASLAARVSACANPAHAASTRATASICPASTCPRPPPGTQTLTVKRYLGRAGRKATADRARAAVTGAGARARRWCGGVWPAHPRLAPALRPSTGRQHAAAHAAQETG